MNARIIHVRMVVHVSIPPLVVTRVNAQKDTQGINVRRVGLKD